MNINNPIFRHSLYFGVALGVTFSVFELIAFLLGLIAKPIMGYINIALTISMVIIAIKKYRSQTPNETISFGHAFQIGFFTCLFSGIIWAFYRFTEYSLAPEIAEDLIIDLEENLINSSMDEDQIEVWVKMYSMGLTPSMRAFSTIFQMAFWGAILSLIIAAIYKREENPLLTDSNR